MKRKNIRRWRDHSRGQQGVRGGRGGGASSSMLVCFWFHIFLSDTIPPFLPCSTAPTTKNEKNTREREGGRERGRGREKGGEGGGGEAGRAGERKRGRECRVGERARGREGGEQGGSVNCSYDHAYETKKHTHVA